MRSIMTLAAVAILVALPALAQAPSPNVPTPPSRPSAAPTAPATSPASPGQATLLDINSASKEQLQALKGIGPARADDIIKGRPYRGKDELLSRKLVPEGVYNDIKDQIVARQRT